MNDPPSAELPIDVLRRLATTMAALKVDDFAFTGGVAVGVCTEPRTTRDVDVCGPLPAAAVDVLLANLDGTRFGPGEVPDAVRFRIGDWEIDYFVSKTEYDREALRRAVSVDLGGVAAKVL